MPEIEFATEHGPVGVAVRLDDEYGRQEVGRIQEVVKSAGSSFSESLTVLRPVAEALLAEVAKIDSGEHGANLKSVSAEFGLELGGSGRFVVAEASAAAAIKVTLTWSLPG